MSASESLRRLDSDDQILLHIIDSSFSDAARRSGNHLACRVGCTECCIGPFPVTVLDARRLRNGLAELEMREPARAAKILRRARETTAVMKGDFPGDAQSGILLESVGPDHPFWTRHGDLPCPALDPETGACELYSARPLTCRTFGPPVRVGEKLLPHCRLCFTGASQNEIESCRMPVDPDGVERAVLNELKTSTGEHGETLIAFALAGQRSITAIS